MKKTHKILGGIFIIFLILSTLGLGVRTEVLDHGTNSLIGFDEMENLTDRTLTINWGNNFSDYDPQGGDAEVVIAIYVPVDYGVNFTNNITLNWSNNNFQFEVNNVSDGNCTELNRMVVEEGGEAPWSTNCTLIVINGTLQNPQKDIGFNLTINITLSDACAGEGGICHNENYQLMFSDLITYEKEVTGAICDLSTYNNTGTEETYCYVNGSEVGAAGVNYSYCSMPENLCYSCAMPGEQSDTVTCNITKGIGSMYNETNISVMDMGVPGGKLLTVPFNEFKIELWAGWNLISIPLVPIVDYKARSTLVDINDQAGQNIADQIALRLESGGYETHLITYPDPNIKNFNVSPGYGYFLHTTNPGNFTVMGSKISGATIDLYPGWNIIGWGKIDESIKARNLLENINAQTGAVCTDQIALRLESGGYETHLITYPDPNIKNFNVSAGYGYFLHVKDINDCQNIQWTLPS